MILVSKRLAMFVHVHRPGGGTVVFGPGDDLPGWAVDAITNPSVWEDSAERVPAPEPVAAQESETQEPEPETPEGSEPAKAKGEPKQNQPKSGQGKKK